VCVSVFGLTSQAPDYAMLTVSAVSGVQRMTREHFALAMALKLPTFICVTKSDVATPKQVQHVLATLKNIISVRPDRPSIPV
jgi:GTPase